MGSVVGPRITDRNIPGNRQPTERALGCLIEVGRAGSNQSGQAADDSRDRLQVRDEQRHLTLASRVVGRPQDRGRVDRRHHVRRERRRDQLPALLCHLEGGGDERLSRGRSDSAFRVGAAFRQGAI